MCSKEEEGTSQILMHGAAKGENSGLEMWLWKISCRVRVLGC